MINIELFSCAGGMAEGFRRAGIHFQMAVDFEAEHCDSYEKNLGYRPICMDVRDLVRMAKLGWRVDIDLFVADPPCTPWSRAGKRLGTADERDMLVETCELIALLKPRRYVIGNVPGLDDSTNWHIVQRHIGGLAVHGYCVADFYALDAADYGVPQHRIRPFWFGHRFGACMKPPRPTHADPATLTTASLFVSEQLKPWLTCRQALGHLEGDELGRPVRIGKRTSVSHPSSRLDEPALTIGCSMPGNGGVTLVAGRRDVPQGNRLGDPDKPAAAVTAKSARAGCGQSHWLEWPWDRPSTTLQRDERIPPPGHHDEYSTRSMPGAVVLSERAAAILQGFPESWVFSGATKKARWSQIGQAMPPALAAAVAHAIAEQDERARATAAVG